MQREGDLVKSNSHILIGDESKQRMKEIYEGKRTFSISKKLMFIANEKDIQFDETIKNKQIVPAFQMIIQKNSLKSGSKSRIINKLTPLKKKKT